VAAARAVELLVDLAGGSALAAWTDIALPRSVATIELDVAHPGRLAGRVISADTVQRRLAQVGARTSLSGTVLEVLAPSWRPDITDPADVAEEVIRLEGYDSIPSVLPAAPAGRGLTHSQRRRRGVARALAGAGFVEVLNYPFISVRDLDALGCPPDDPRRNTLRLANPISETEPLLRTTLLPGLLAALRRNLGRGNSDLALYEIGRVFRPLAGAPPAPRPPVDRRATAASTQAVGGRPDGFAVPIRLVGPGPQGRLGRRDRGITNCGGRSRCRTDCASGRLCSLASRPLCGVDAGDRRRRSAHRSRR
jgi:phenylalanyl-tRNA synthetase beta chain